MLEMLSPGRSLTWDLVWQSSVFLALGLGASVLLRRCPAQAHRVLILSMAAALGTPLLAQAIRQGGWGLLRQPEPIQAASEMMIAPEPKAAPAEFLHVATPSPRTGNLQAGSDPEQFLPDRVARAASDTSWPRDHERPAPAPGSSTTVKIPSWRQVFLTFWVCLTGLAILRFAISFVMGLRLIRGSFPAADPEYERAVAQAATRLGLAVRPEVRSSPHVRCPSVWCWGRQPILLVPARIAQENDAIDWIAVFSHELAHWHRMDHVASLASEMVICALSLESAGVVGKDEAGPVCRARLRRLGSGQRL